MPCRGTPRAEGFPVMRRAIPITPARRPREKARSSERARAGGVDPGAPPEGAATAKEAGLRYVSDHQPGLSRKPRGKSFRYLDRQGKAVRDPDVLARIRSLVIPPAWTDVWICAVANGHIQATGRDQRGRKQYRYHPRWREVRDDTKYERILSFARALPALRKRCDEELRRPGLPREKVLATVVRLLEVTLIRVGNEEYARTNASFGLTTMREEHVVVEGTRIHFHFRGKSGKQHAVDVSDQRLARIVARCQDLPGDELFHYLDADGKAHTIESADVNGFLRDVTGGDFTAKDFRTWAGTVLAAQALRAFEAFGSAAQAKRNVVAAIKQVAGRLGNTPTVCRKCYVHPLIVETYLHGELVETLRHRAESMLRDELHDLPPEEAAVLALLQQKLATAPA